ncbi:MAG: hypothetical protein R2861_14465 [Desulfobacterales bacterium]
MERQIHHLVNYIQGIMHIGQRDISWSVSAKVCRKRIFLERHRRVLHAKFHQDFQKIVDKVQVTLFTRKKKKKKKKKADGTS